MGKACYYDILNIPKEIEQGKIKRAYHKLAMKYHPDKNPDNDEAQNKMAQVAEAYKILSDPKTRKVYDNFGHEGLDSCYADFASNFNASDIINDLFGVNLRDLKKNIFSEEDKEEKVDEFHVHTTVDLTIEEACNGVVKKVVYNKNVLCDRCEGDGLASDAELVDCKECQGDGYTLKKSVFLHKKEECQKCHGTGKVPSRACTGCHGKGLISKEFSMKMKIPKNVRRDQKLKIEGKGHTLRSGEKGNLYIHLNIIDSEEWSIEKDNVLINLPIKVWQAVLGDSIKIKTPNGELAINIPKGSQPNSKIVLKNKGLKNILTKEYGDVVVTLKVKTPTDISEEEQTLYEHLKNLK